MAWKYCTRKFRHDKKLQLQTIILALLLGTSYYTLFMIGRMEILLFDKYQLETITLPAVFSIFTALHHLVSILFFALAIFFTIFTTLQRVTAKKKEIALLSAIGHSSRIFWYVFWESMVSTLMAVISGILGALLLACISQLLSDYHVPFPFIFTLIYTAVFILVTYFTTAYVTRYYLSKSFRDIRVAGVAVNRITEEIFLPDKDHGFFSHGFNLITAVFLRGQGKITKKIARRQLLRSLTKTRYYFILSCVITAIMTFSLTGSIVVSDTSHGYIEGFYGDSLCLVTYNETAEFFLPFYEFTGVNTTPYNQNTQWVDVNAFTDAVSGLVSAVDDRIIVYTAIKEYPGRYQSTEGVETTVGGVRRANAIVQGINPDHLVQSWSYSGTTWRKASESTPVMIIRTVTSRNQ
ncbi:MAG: FtsX-like permease family protein [Candidatus Hodarchaeales archaeon]